LVFGFLDALISYKKWKLQESYQHWLDPKITLALIAIPLGIVGFKKENKLMVISITWHFFMVSLVIGLMHYQ
jgi:hypothetical protein